jgi:copper chaperone CopZ
VQAVDAGAKVDVDLKSKKVRIETGAGLNAVTSAISDAGYQVTASTAV